MQIQLSEEGIKSLVAAIDESKLDLAGSVALQQLRKAVKEEYIPPQKNSPDWHYKNSK